MGGKCASEARMGRRHDGEPRGSQPPRPTPHRRGSAISSESDGLVEPSPAFEAYARHLMSDPAIDETWRFIWDRGGIYSPPISPCHCIPDGGDAHPDQTGQGGSPPGDPSHGHSCVKREPSSDRDLKLCSVESVCSGASSDFTIILPPITQPNADPAWASPAPAAAAGREGRRLPSPSPHNTAPSSSRSEPSTAMILGVLQRHQMLFETLRSICVMAARHCWYHEAREWAPSRTFLTIHRKPFPAREGIARLRPLHHPYGIPSRDRLRPTELRLPSLGSLPSEGFFPRRCEFTTTVTTDSHRPRHEDALHRYIFRIADALWNRGKKEVCTSPCLVPSTAVEKDALNRMQALFRLADRVVEAVNLVNQGTWIADLDLDLELTGALRFFRSRDSAFAGTGSGRSRFATTTNTTPGNGSDDVNGIFYSAQRSRPHGTDHPNQTQSHVPNQSHAHQQDLPVHQTYQAYPNQDPNRSSINNNGDEHGYEYGHEIQQQEEGEEEEETEGGESETIMNEHLGEVVPVLMAARDLCALCSYDAGVQAVDAAWEEWEEWMMAFREHKGGWSSSWS